MNEKKLERKQRLKRGETAAEISELEARLQQAAESDLAWDRRDDLNDSFGPGEDEPSEEAAAADTVTAAPVPASTGAAARPSSTAAADREQNPPSGRAATSWITEMNRPERQDSFGPRSIS